MSYRVALQPRAKESLRRCSRFLRLAVGDHLKSLAESPVSLSRSASFPHPADSQTYEFDVEDPFGSGGWHHFAVFFRYGQDEQTISIIAIGHTEF
jgi:hypothetical protein